MDLEVFFAGTAGSVPTGRRGMPALLVRRGGERILFDCGEGTQRQLVSSVGLADLDALFLTHFHLDHWLGMPGMLKTFALRDRDRPLTINGPPGLRNLMGMLRPIVGKLPYDVKLVELEAGEPVRARRLRHRPVPRRAPLHQRLRLRARRGRAARAPSTRSRRSAWA